MTKIQLDVESTSVLFSESWDLLVAKLEDLQVEHLRVTLKGRYEAGWFDGGTFFTEVLRKLICLKSFTLQIGSRLITGEEKAQISSRIERELLNSLSKRPIPRIGMSDHFAETWLAFFYEIASSANFGDGRAASRSMCPTWSRSSIPGSSRMATTDPRSTTFSSRE